MLEDAKNQADILVVGLHTNPNLDRDNKNKPIQTTFERFLLLKNSKHVDEIIPYDTEKDLSNMLAVLDINVRFLGEEYQNTEATGQQICRARGIEIIYLSRKHMFSSTELRKRLDAQ